MFSDYKIIDNALSNEKFAILEEKIMSSRMPWFYSYNVADGTKKEEDMYFMHLYYLGMSDKPRIDQMANLYHQREVIVMMTYFQF